MEGKPKVQTFTSNDDIPTSKDMKMYNEIVNEMRESKDQMDKKYGQGWDGLTRREYDWMMSLSDRKDEIEAKYPNYDFKNKKIKNEIRQKGNDKMENKNLEFLNKVEKRQSVNDFEIRAVEDGQMVGTGDAPYNQVAYGGKTVTSFSQYVVDCIEKENPLMGYADVLKCQSNIKFVIDKSPAKEAVIVKEGGKANFEQFEFDAVDVQVQKMLSICKFTNEIAQDSSINLPVHVSQKLAKSFALKVEHDMTDCLVNAGEEVQGALNYDELVKLQHSLPVRSRNGKRTVMVASSDAVLAMKLLKNQDGSSLMQPNPNNPLEFRVLGLPLVESPFLEAGTVVVADMEALFVGVSKNLEMTTLNELYAENGVKAVMAEMRYAVHCKQNEKVKVFKVQA